MKQKKVKPGSFQESIKLRGLASDFSTLNSDLQTPGNPQPSTPTHHLMRKDKNMLKAIAKIQTNCQLSGLSHSTLTLDLQPPFVTILTNTYQSYK